MKEISICSRLVKIILKLEQKMTKLYINGKWQAGNGEVFSSQNPLSGEIIWQGHGANAEDINEAAKSARVAFAEWGFTTREKRLEIIEKFQTILENNKQQLAEIIAQETGKVLWDASSEVAAMIGKLKFSLQALQERAGEKTYQTQEFTAHLRHKPHGVVAVFGPYNFPAHLPNGHIIPALLAGNTVIFKPSELTPLVAEKTIEFWHQAGIPAGVINLVQGGRETGKALAEHSELDGLFFTGSCETGKILHQQFANTPQKILALELGGNNPLIVNDVADVKAAAYQTIQSAYITAGQRCTCARRLIVPESNAEFINYLTAMVNKISPEKFMGSLISNKEADKLLKAQDELLALGGVTLVKMQRVKDNFPMLTPALIDVTAIKNRPDKEFFGPLLQLIRVPNIEAAIIEANNTKYGLSAAIFTDSSTTYEYFLKNIRAGIVNWNRPTTGASGNLPFGGIGLSGNHRPSAYYAVDYCAYPVASNEAEKLALPAQIAAGIEI